ncbi:hypothetical protein ACHXCE_003106 [Escherichia coli]
MAAIIVIAVLYLENHS